MGVPIDNWEGISRRRGLQGAEGGGDPHPANLPEVGLTH